MDGKTVECWFCRRVIEFPKRGQHFCGKPARCKDAYWNREKMSGIQFNPEQSDAMLEFAKELGKTLKEMLWDLFAEHSGHIGEKVDEIKECKPLGDDQVWGGKPTGRVSLSA